MPHVWRPVRQAVAPHPHGLTPAQSISHRGGLLVWYGSSGGQATGEPAAVPVVLSHRRSPDPTLAVSTPYPGRDCQTPAIDQPDLGHLPAGASRATATFGTPPADNPVEAHTAHQHAIGFRTSGCGRSRPGAPNPAVRSAWDAAASRSRLAGAPSESPPAAAPGAIACRHPARSPTGLPRPRRCMPSCLAAPDGPQPIHGAPRQRAGDLGLVPVAVRGSCGQPGFRVATVLKRAGRGACGAAEHLRTGGRLAGPAPPGRWPRAGRPPLRRSRRPSGPRAGETAPHVATSRWPWCAPAVSGVQADDGV